MTGSHEIMMVWGGGCPEGGVWMIVVMEKGCECCAIFVRTNL